MNIKNKIITYITVLIMIIVTLTTSVLGGAAEDAAYALSNLLQNGSNKVGETIKLSINELKTRTDLYCIQHKKSINSNYKNYKVRSYIEIDGKEAKIYTASNQTEPTIVNANINAEVAYILSKKMGYGASSTEITEAQNALWYINNAWMKTLFGENVNSYITDGAYWGNDEATKQNLNTEAEAYANSIGDYKSTTLEPMDNLVDKTDKDSISVTDVGEYYRVGPFKWQFDGVLESITVKGDNGDLSSSDVRFVKYEGTTAKTVSASEILTEESFYVDVKYTSGTTELKGLKLKAKVIDTLTIYTAKIWILDSADNDLQNLLLADVKSTDIGPVIGEGDVDYNIPLNISIGFEKVDDRNTDKKLSGVGFKFKATVYRYIPVTVNTYQWQWVERYLGTDLKWSSDTIDGAETFYTDENGKIKIDGVSGENTLKNSIKAIEVSNPNYGYEIGGEYVVGTADENIVVGNHQTKVKFSGYVWLDEVAEKMSIRNDQYDSGSEKGINGITVYLRDIDGNEIGRTNTSELGLYSEINGGEYQFVDVDLDKIEADQYYVEFEYCGITYQSVLTEKEKNDPDNSDYVYKIANSSKATDETSRNILDSKFTSVDSTGTQNLTVNGVNINYNNVSNHTSTIASHTGCDVTANTSEAGYDLYDHGFVPGSEEIRNVNLGLYEKPQADYALSQDLYNVRAEVNGFAHIYRYAGVRYTNGVINEESSWNLGVKFQNNTGTYRRAIYEADVNYTTEDKDKELKLYLTYKVALRNESTYLARINSIIDYCDSRYELISAGIQIDDNDNITETLNVSQKQAYNDKYSKYVVDTNLVMKPGETTYLYVQFRIDREAILTLLNNGETLNNLTEINSYTTFKNNDINTPVSAIDQDSVPGNVIPGQINTYEDDTDAARSLQLELANERALEGTVFEDSTGKDSNVIYSGEERLGNGIFDQGETTIGKVKVALNDENGNVVKYYDEVSKEWKDAITETDENGNFTFRGFIPGNYVITYTWGDKTYMVQYYKGTIYDASRNQNDRYWYKVDQDIRKTDALDDLAIREQIDNEMESVTTNILDAEINKAYESGSEFIKTTTMDSSSPIMSISVEYETVITDGIGDQILFTIKNVDFGIVERAKQQLELDKRVSEFKLTLANGQVLINAEVTEDGQLKGLKDNLTYMGPTSMNEIDVNGLLKAEMDSELIEGAIIETTYVVKAKNTGELDYESGEYYHYGDKTNADLIKVSASGVIDYLDGRLAPVYDENWQEVDEVFLSNYNVTKNADERIFVTSKLGEEIRPGESTEELKFKTSKLLTTSNDNYFNNKVEIIEAKKSDARITGAPIKVTFSEGEGTYHFDIDNSEAITIIPSTGEDRAYVLPIIIGISSLVILGVGIFVIKKFVLNNK